MTKNTKARESSLEVESAPSDEITEARAVLAEAEAKVAELTQQVFVTMPAEQRELQTGIDDARRRNDANGMQSARLALDDAKRRRNACIDELEHAKRQTAVIKAELARLERAEQRGEMIAKAASVATATHSELIEEHRQLPARLAQASRELDVEAVRALRRRLAELPDEIYAAAVLEAGRTSEELRALATVKRSEATALEPDLAAAEERLRLAQEERDRIVTDIRWLQGDAQEAEQSARGRERQLEDLIAQAFRS